MAKKPAMETLKGRSKIRGLARMANITRTGARQILDNETVGGSGKKDPAQRDRWLFRRGVMP